MNMNSPRVEAALSEGRAASILSSESRGTIATCAGKKWRRHVASRQSRLYTAMAVAMSLAAAHAQDPNSAVSGVSGVKQDAVDRIKPVTPVVPPPPASNSTQAVNKVEGIDTIDGVKAAGRAAPPPPPPPASVTPAGGGSVGAAATIQAVSGVGGIDTAKMQNLEAALIMKEDGGGTPVGGAERGGQGKAAAAALLSAPLDKPAPKLRPKEDGRAGFQEFEKLQSRGS